MKKELCVLLLLFVLAAGVPAAGPAIWSVNSRADVLKGDSHGVSISQDGTITLAPKISEAFKTEQAYIWSSAVDAAGNTYLGTGSDGKVYKVTPVGAGSLLTDLAEMNVTALAIGRSGELFAGTSPDGKVYRIDAAGKADVYFEPQEKYIWSLAVMSDGSLAIGTGDGGRIYKVNGPAAPRQSSLLFDTTETHIISLAIDKQGDLIAGSDPNGLVIRFNAQGQPFGLLDAALREIHSLSIGADGSIYVLALGDSASAAAKPANAAATPTPTPESKVVTIAKPGPSTEPAPKSRYELTGAKSAVYRILPDGGSDLLWASTTVTGFSLLARATGTGVALGTSDKGRIYNIGNDGSETLVMQTGADQISTIRSAGTGLIATSSNPGSLYRIGPETVADGSYESAVLDAKAAAAWGRIWWRSAGTVTVQTRTGNTEKPNETWSAWAAAQGAQITSPKARYLQWRATLTSSLAGTSLSEVNIAFSPRNIAPEVLSIQVLPTNVGLIANPAPAVDPNIALTGLDSALFGVPNVTPPPRRVYQRGATSLQWTTDDRNGDKLVYDIYYREIGDSQFRLLKGDLSENFYTIDGQSLADGRYIFKVVARDVPSNPPPTALEGERWTEPIDVDNTPPTVNAVGQPQVNGDRAHITFEAMDAASYLVNAEYSVNGGGWVPTYPEDGISDSPRERYSFDVDLPKAGEYAITLRAFDVNGNAGTSRFVVRK